MTDIANIHHVLERMQDIGMPLLVHGEVTDPAIDIFDREAVFIDRILLKTLMPTSRRSRSCSSTSPPAKRPSWSPPRRGPNLAATITPQHLMLNRNAMFDGGLRPHAYCLPVAKREVHRLAVRKAAVSGSPNIFLGTDSAPHSVGAKESGLRLRRNVQRAVRDRSLCPGVRRGKRARPLEGFASENGPRFYGLPLNDGRITLTRGGEDVPASIGGVVPFGAGKSFGWRLAQGS